MNTIPFSTPRSNIYTGKTVLSVLAGAHRRGKEGISVFICIPNLGMHNYSPVVLVAVVLLRGDEIFNHNVNR
jgi:hypothetical protein